MTGPADGGVARAVVSEVTREHVAGKEPTEKVRRPRPHISGSLILGFWLIAKSIHLIVT
jgi:hypothetical protein